MQGSSTLPWKNQSSISPFTVTSGSSGNLSNGVPAATVGVNRSASSSSMYKTKKKKSELDLKRKLTKDDISLPSNFRYKFKFYFVSCVYYLNITNIYFYVSSDMWHT